MNLQPISDYEKINLLFKQSYEARQILAVEHDFHIGEIEDIREPVGLAARGKVLEPLTLAHVAQALANIRYLHSTLSKMAEDFPVIWDIAKNIVELRSLEKASIIAFRWTGKSRIRLRYIYLHCASKSATGAIRC